ncbi:MAG: hypothetical protein HPY90_14585 [Syntrophothermus sp.]|uniref:hypothetical protein n=1 Tax=Syntrophothermus sp. TaxID=2736299 RepID=UPI0025803060|nr:hypothetical protein [Syntrophothermus sp.]NSW84459.1 hypothetical protein [Syntrophothermus sp.]
MKEREERKRACAESPFRNFMVKTVGDTKIFTNTPTEADVRAAVNSLQPRYRGANFQITFLGSVEVPLGVGYKARVRQITVSFHQNRDGELYYTTHLWRAFPLTDLPVGRIRSIRAVPPARAIYQRKETVPFTPYGTVRGRKIG